MDPLALGTLSLQSKYILSPMEEVSDVGFRRLCYAQGAGLTWTEMIRASGIVRKNKATLDLIDTHDPDTLTGIQLFAVNERELAVALYRLEQLAHSSHRHFMNIRAIDLNFGCPSPDVIRIGAGPALLKRTSKMEAMFDKLAHWRKTTKLPIGAIGAKIRLGLNQQEQDHKVYLRLVEPASRHLDYLAVHARHAKQRSRDPVSWGAIGEIKAIARIPVIGNGDVAGEDDAQRMLAQTGCEGVMLARAAIRSPWVFRELTGTGPALATPDEIDAAEREYLAIAQRFSTKPKYVAFHRENFARMRGAGAPVVPRNSNLA